MANPEHLEILKQGVEAWDKWRTENPGITYKKFIDEIELLFYHHLNTGKEVIKKHMSSNHSEVAET